MININNNKTFAELVMKIIEDKYDILFDDYASKPDVDWSTLSISFSINIKDNSITVPINYRTQTIDSVVNIISKKIDTLILNSYLK